MTAHVGGGAKPHHSHLFPEAVADWFKENGVLVVAVAQLRQGANHEAAVAALLEQRPLVALRTAWELWPLLGFDEDADPEELLVAALGQNTLDLCRFALWGEEPPAGRLGLRLVR